MPKRKSTEAASTETQSFTPSLRAAAEAEDDLLAIALHDDDDDSSDSDFEGDTADEAESVNSGSDDDDVEDSDDDEGDENEDIEDDAPIEDQRGSAAEKVLDAWSKPSKPQEAGKPAPVGVGARARPATTGQTRVRSGSEDSGYTSKSGPKPSITRPQHFDATASKLNDVNSSFNDLDLSADPPSELPWWRQHPEIDPVYESDTTDDETTNTVGNIPLSWYDEYDHVGYDKDGKKIVRGTKPDALDDFLARVDGDSDAWRTIHDALESRNVVLSKDDLALIRRALGGKFAGGVDPYEPTIEWFTSKVEEAPLSAAPEPKRRWAPSKHEARRVMKIVRAIRRGLNPAPAELPSERTFPIWDSTQGPQPISTHVMHIPAPKVPPPTDHESYNPPPELVPTEEEAKAWKEEEEGEREKNFLPTKYGKMRDVPGWDMFLKERFERCLDLYLCPRVRKNKIQMNPEDLLPTLPDPSTLRPFPTHLALALPNHPSLVRHASLSPSGAYLVTGCDDGVMRVFEVSTGRMWAEWDLGTMVGGTGKTLPVRCAAWNPNSEIDIVAAAVGGRVVLVETGTGNSKAAEGTERAIATDADAGAAEKGKGKNKPAEWRQFPKAGKEGQEGLRVAVDVGGTVTSVVWHRRGDYFASIGGEAANPTVLIHQLSRRASQSPFSKSKGAVQHVAFHPSKPEFFVATQRSIRCYDLVAQTLLRKLQSSARWISCMSVHPLGDNVIAGSYDKRVCWWDTDLGSTPYKTIRSHSLAVRSAAFHPSLPLFVSSSDDCTVQVFHATVYQDLLRNPLVVPVKTLKGFHTQKNGLGILGVCWHPREAWCVSWGADGKVGVWGH
ncbi:Ribosome biogenesis protein erb1 [Gonapodya sp. JEL0774]|nr:Ribosome biogenesis protein erb1 [Gonapodya sp. JEL0774]